MKADAEEALRRFYAECARSNPSPRVQRANLTSLKWLAVGPLAVLIMLAFAMGVPVAPAQAKPSTWVYGSEAAAWTPRPNREPIRHSELRVNQWSS
jgi:hypothetical protein